MFEWGRKGTGPGEFTVPYDIAADSSGRLFVADAGNKRIQVFDANGTYLTAWTHGHFQKPAGIAVSPDGTVYISDVLANALFAFTPNGDGSYGEKWAFKDPSLNWPHGVAFGRDGEMYLADNQNHRILVVSPSGALVNTLASSDTLDTPNGVAACADGSVLITDAHGVWKASPTDGSITPWAENSGFVAPYGITVARDGSVWVTDEKAHCFFHFTAEGRLLSRYGAQDGPDMLDTPTGLALDRDENIVAVDQKHRRLVRYDPNGRFLDEITAWTGMDGLPESFSRPARVVVDEEGNLLVSDTTKRAVLVFSREGSFLRGIGGPETDGEGLKQPWGLALGPDGRIYVAEMGGSRISVFQPDGTPERTLMRDGLSTPAGVAVGPDGSVYVADFGHNRVVRLSQEDRVLAEFGGNRYGFRKPNNVTLDPDGNLFVTDQDNQRIVKLSPTGSILSVFGEAGSLSGQLQIPEAGVAAPDGRFYVADSHNHRIQVFAPGIETLHQKAILVAGGGPYPSNDLWDATRLSAHLAYAALKHQGFPRDRIRYYSHDVGLDLDNNGLGDDITGVPALSLLDRAVSEWSADAEWLILYLVDHGGTQSFRLGPSETITGADLAGILRKRAGKTLVILDACRSGSFLNALDGDDRRIIIAGSGPEEPAHFVGGGSISLSGRFWSGVLTGESVADAFSNAKAFLAEAGIPQIPELFWGNDAGGADFHIGLGMTSDGSPLLANPALTWNGMDGRLSLRVSATDPDRALTRVWATLKPDALSIPSPDSPVLDLPTVELSMTGEGEYAADVALPFAASSLMAAFYARDAAGVVSGPLIRRLDNVTTPVPVALLIGGDSDDPEASASVAAWIDSARRALQIQGYADDDILALHPAGPDAPTQIEAFLSRYTPETVRELAVYIVGSRDDTPVSPADLAQSIEGFPNAVIIWDAPRAANDELSPLSAPGRIVLAGFPQGPFTTAPVFSEFFWDDVARGLSLGTAFQRIDAFGSEENAPYLDDDGDGVFRIEKDGRMAPAAFWAWDCDWPRRPNPIRPLC